MPTTYVHGFATQAEAQEMANNYSDVFKVEIVGGTDEIVITRDGEEVVWSSAPGGALYLVIATKDSIARQE